MELTNEQRKYLGLEIMEPSWERVEIPNNCLKPELSTEDFPYIRFAESSL